MTPYFHSQVSKHLSFSFYGLAFERGLLTKAEEGITKRYRYVCKHLVNVMSYFTVLLMLIKLYVEKAETEKKEVGEDD